MASEDSVTTVKERIVKGEGTWVLEREFGTEGEGKMEWAYGICISPNKDIVVTRGSENKVSVFDSEGKFKQVLHGGDLDWTNGVAVNSEGNYFVVDGYGTPYVKVYGPDGEFIREFPAKSHQGKWSNADGRCRLLSVTIDHEGYVWIGATKRYLSKHTQDGTHVASFKTTKPPAFVTITTKGRIIFSPEDGLQGAQVLDHTGNRLCMINAPPGVQEWRPSGLCSVDDDVFFVCSWSSEANDGGVFCFTVDGEYVGCVTRSIIEAFGIAFTKDYKLLVAEFRGHPVKVFSNILSS